MVYCAAPCFSMCEAAMWEDLLIRLKRAVAQQVKMPPGYYIEWSGQYENQISARKRLELVIPLVLLVIFVLLYRTYDSAKEAAHVLLAVPFALTGGIFLVKALGLNFSVAVWVGFIALFGTAVQTGVVMVIYLEEAVARRKAADGNAHARGSACGRDGGRPATASSQGHDRCHCRCRPAAAAVVHAHRRRIHEAARRTGAGRDGELAPSRADCDTGHLHLAA